MARTCIYTCARARHTSPAILAAQPKSAPNALTKIESAAREARAEAPPKKARAQASGNKARAEAPPQDHGQLNDMARRYDRVTLVERLHAEIDAGRPIYDALCGSGITAKMAARGGADMITTHCLAYFRMQGMSSMAGYLPICDANALTLELGERVLVNVVRECPLVAGLLCVDPTRDMTRFLERIQGAGYDGVMNCPTVALIDGKFRSDLEETGMGFTREVEVLASASRIGAVYKGVLYLAGGSSRYGGGWRRQYYRSFRQQLRWHNQLENGAYGRCRAKARCCCARCVVR
jgi:hypothetical protein